jgi:chemotaxis signal transduction protein
MSNAEPGPVELFRMLESDNLGNQLLEEPVDASEVWRGFVFKVENLTLVAPFVGEYEIIPCNEIFPLPLAKSWIKGMTNIRGEIYSVVDFSEFIGQKPVRTTRGCNLILLPDRQLKSALMINSQVRLQSFSSNMATANTEILGPGLVPYLSTVLVDGDQQYGILDVQALMESAVFSSIARQ